MHLFRLRRVATVVLLGVFCVARLPATLAHTGEARIVPGPPEAPDFIDTSHVWVVNGYDSSCRIRRISFGNSECSLGLYFHHGWTWFGCAKDKRDWYWTNGASFGAINTLVGATRHAELPTHAEERKSWIGPLDREGEEGAPIISIDHVIDWYPRTILKSDLRPWPGQGNQFPIVTQAVTYETMHGQARTFVGARITLAPGAELTLYNWVEPGKDDEASRAAEHLASIRLIDVVDPPADEMKEACQRPQAK